MTKLGTRSRVGAVGILLLLQLVILPPARPQEAKSTRGAEATAQIGRGWWETLLCIGCVSGFAVAGGTTVIGVAAAIAAFPEVAAACALTCAIALE